MYWLCDRNFSNMISKFLHFFILWISNVEFKMYLREMCIYIYICQILKLIIKINIKYMYLKHPSCSLCTLTMQDDLYNSYCWKQSSIDDVLILHFPEYKPHTQNSIVFKWNILCTCIIICHNQNPHYTSSMVLHVVIYVYYLKHVILISGADKSL